MTIQDEFERSMNFYMKHKLMVTQELGLGSVFGFCSGYFSRKMTKLGMFITGGLFMTSQFVSSSGYVNIEWSLMEQDAVRAFDQNGDQKFDGADVQILYNKFMKTLQYRLPSTTGFTTGFLLGFMKGK